jgi:thiol-disulfide isomerase/thioredoxin
MRIALTPALMLGILAVPVTAGAQETTAPHTTDAVYVAEMKNGETALRLRQLEDALRAFKRASAISKKTSAEAFVGLAKVYTTMGNEKDAVDAYSDALKNVGSDTRLESLIRNQRGLLLLEMAGFNSNEKRLKEAEADFRAALALDESAAINHYNLGVTLLRQNRDAEGLPELERFIERAPRAPEAKEAKLIIEGPRRAREPFAPEFSFTALKGERISLEGLRGKVVVLDFWATWCPPCLAATDSLIKLNKKYAGQPVVMLGISADRDRAAWERYIDKEGTTWPQHFDTGRLRAMYQVNTFPTYIVIDHEGIIRDRRSGWSPAIYGFLDGQIKKQLKALEQIPR